MVVCKFFLQGYCRFGDICKFEHQIGDTYNANKTQYTSILWQSQLGNTQFQNQSNASFPKQTNPIFTQENKSTNSPGNVDVDTLIKSVVNDMMALENSGQWLLSCYGPFKEKSVFPGFEDYSFEEIRFGFYDALKNGTIEHYKQHVNGLLQQAVLRIKSLQKPTPEIVEILKNIYYAPVTQTVPNSSSIFGNSSTVFNPTTIPNQNSSIFAQANQNLFGKPANQTQVFPNPTGNIFGETQKMNNQPQLPTQNVFGQGNANLNLQNTGSIFGNQQSNSIPASSTNTFQTVYGQPVSKSNVFGNQNNIFQQTNTTTTPPSIFGNQSTQQFLQAPQQPAAPTGNIFAFNQGTASSIPQQTSIFNSPSFITSTPQQQQPQGSIFGNQYNKNSNSPFFQPTNTEANQNRNVFSKDLITPSFDESLYSKLEELSEEEINWFQSENPDPMTIPEKPPTFEMCFKT